ncbi:jerky protein homolog-like [Belonocnema kinseyi]|uniref:jerky protein homolog-like n=1 Tax=Belonocnema kinseyi TaxID=2817044 RepID=UPI00143D0E2D|nr:jerky protein homolog-like [Belonocnema kinseyi]
MYKYVVHKQKRQRLTFKQKCELLDKVKAGTSKQDVLQKYGISDFTYRRLLAREADLSNKFKNYEYQNKKSSKTSNDVLLDAAVFEWFKQARERGDPMSGPIIKEKALILNEKLNGPKTFKASTGWLDGFKKRYGIRLKEEKLSNDPSGASEFSPIFKAKIEFENLKPDNIYNADESGILWRLLTACTFALQLEEEEASKIKECKDRVTALFCANASGSHRIPLLIIGKSETPRSLDNLVTKNSEDLRLKNLESLGVIYTHQTSAWMDRCIFMLWYKDVFIPRVLERQRRDGITGKVVLLLDSAPSHPSLDELNAINENFEVLYLPPNATELIQPMDQGLIATIKKLYKKDLLKRLLLRGKSEEAVQFLKGLDLADFFGMLCLAWNALTLSDLQRAWKPLLGESLHQLEEEEEEEEEEDPLSIDDVVFSESEFPTGLISFPHEICDQVSELLSGPDYSVEESREFLLKWFENDHNDSDCGWESSSDSDIVNLVKNGRRDPEIATKIGKSETMFENPDTLNFVTCGRLESEIVTKIENSENIFGNPDIINFVKNERGESEVVTKHANSEAMIDNNELVELMSSEGEPEIITKIENSEALFENPDIINFVTNVGREPEIITKIENSETMFDNTESMEITSSEALGCLVKLKNWAKSQAECLPKHLDYIRELENLITERKVCKLAQHY